MNAKVCCFEKGGGRSHSSSSGNGGGENSCPIAARQVKSVHAHEDDLCMAMGTSAVLEHSNATKVWLDMFLAAKDVSDSHRSSTWDIVKLQVRQVQWA